jgi:hypothetical protein
LNLSLSFFLTTHLFSVNLSVTFQLLNSGQHHNQPLWKIGHQAFSSYSSDEPWPVEQPPLAVFPRLHQTVLG